MKSGNGRPLWYAWYPNDWAGSAIVRCMTLEQRGAYRELLDWQWQQPDGKIPLEMVATLSLMGSAWDRKENDIIRQCFKIESGKAWNEKLYSMWEQAKAHISRLSEAGQIGNAKRWGSHKGSPPDPKRDPSLSPSLSLKASLTNPPTPLNGVDEPLPESPKALTVDAYFDAFWTAYPRKIGKLAALRAWQKAKGKPDIQRILAAVDEQRHSEQWKKDGGQFIPHPATWINQGRWDDQTTTTPASQKRKTFQP